MSAPETETTEEEPGGVPTEDEPATTEEPDTGEEEANEEEAPQSLKEAAAKGGDNKLTKEIERQIKANRRAFERIFAQDLEKEVCAACGGAGFFGEKETTLDDLEVAKDVIPCPDCKALGQVKTGSKVPGQLTKSCGTCHGNGYTSKPYEVAQPTPLPAITTTTAAQPMVGEFIPGKGFHAFGSDEFIPVGQTG